MYIHHTKDYISLLEFHIRVRITRVVYWRCIYVANAGTYVHHMKNYQSSLFTDARYKADMYVHYAKNY